jgi:hypothetical protein
VLLLAGAIVGLLVGLTGGGDLRGLAALRIRWPLVVVLALAVKELGVWTPLAQRQDLTPWLFTASLAVLVAWTLWHVNRLPGVWLVTLGLAMNLAVVALNGGHMPVPLALAHRGPTQLVQQGVLGQYVLEGPQTRLAMLGDWIRLPWPLGALFPQAYSPGDLVSLAGMFVVALLVTRRPVAPRAAQGQT